MKKHIAVVPGDGIGEEVMEQALRVLSKIAEQFNHQFILTPALAGGAAFENLASIFPMKRCKSAASLTQFYSAQSVVRFQINICQSGKIAKLIRF
ncbi:unnamed protein product [Sphagnum balticum]